MSLTYTWKIKGLRKTNVASLTDVVVAVYWECKGTDESNNSGTYVGFTELNVQELNSESFVNFNNLTEETVLSWIQPIILNANWRGVEQVIQKEIDNKKNPIVTVSNMPWDFSANT